MELQRTGSYNLMYIQTKKLGWKENHGVKKFASQTYGNTVAGQRQVLKIWKNYITELYDPSNQLENL
jgi:hypothetical protein